jgi:DNA-binding beta-propeller fold protein YncE
MRHACLLLASTFFGATVGAAADVKPSYVAVLKASGHVGFFDADGKVLKEVKIGGHPHEMTFSPDGRYVYTTDNGVLWMTETGQGGNTVSIVDTRTQMLAGTIDLGKYRRPHGIDVDPKTGNLLVTTELPSMLLMVDPRVRKVVKEYDVKGKAPHLVKLAADRGWAYTSNTDTGTVSAVNLQTGEVKVIPTGEPAEPSPVGRWNSARRVGLSSITPAEPDWRGLVSEIAVFTPERS